MTESKNEYFAFTNAEAIGFIRRQAKWVASITFGFMLVSAIISVILPNKYTSRTLLLPPKEAEDLSSLISGQLGGLGSLAASASGLKLKDPNEYYLGLLKSLSIADTIIKRHSLKKEYNTPTMQDTRVKLSMRTEIESRKDGMISVSFTDASPQLAAQIANDYGNELTKLLGRLGKENASSRRIFFEIEMRNAHKKLGETEDSLRNFLQGQQVIDVSSSISIHVEEQAKIQAEIFARQIALKTLSTSLAPDNPEYNRLKNEITEFQKRSKFLKQSGFGGQQGDSGILGLGTNYGRLYRDLKYQEAIYTILAQQFEAAKISESKAGMLVQVVDPASPPEKRSSPKRRMIVLIAGFLGTIIGIGSGCIREKKHQILAIWNESKIRGNS